MKRKAKNVIIPKGGIAELQRLVKKEKISKIKERLQAILWAAQKESNLEIARRLNKNNIPFQLNKQYVFSSLR